MRTHNPPVDIPQDSRRDEGFSLRRWSQRKHAARAVSDAPPPVVETSEIQTSEIPLPPVDSLSFESDFTPFMQLDVQSELRRDALRKLVRDPRFNVMDGLDVYIDDYSKPDPIEPAVARALAQARYIFAPPQTRVNECGCVEDVPHEPEDALADTAPAAALEPRSKGAEPPQ